MLFALLSMDATRSTLEGYWGSRGGAPPQPRPQTRAAVFVFSSTARRNPTMIKGSCLCEGVVSPSFRGRLFCSFDYSVSGYANSIGELDQDFVGADDDWKWVGG